MKIKDKFNKQTGAAPYKTWGHGFESTAILQMENACRLPVSVAGALMPDAHQGYGLPIGGVLATEGAVIPYAVGMDIACRMKLSVFDMPVKRLHKKIDIFEKAIEEETRFGVGSRFRHYREHEVMDDNAWSTKFLSSLKINAWSQLGTSGAGNHFAEFGELILKKEELGLSPGIYLAFLTHSGSRGCGADIAKHFSRLAQKIHPELPAELKALAWLDMKSKEGQEYWEAMNLMGRYAAANHELIHKFIAENLGVEVLLDIENHHNFAWKESYHGKDLIVHRKGATPAGKNDTGIIPGSMGTNGYIVRGKGVPESLNSASHGAGRKMSRKAAINKLDWKRAKKMLDDQGITLLSAGLDEVPDAYKNIEKVMAAQKDLVEIIACFKPKIVKMAPGKSRKWKRRMK
jgi:tRNA-splicing ligase RtcB (3'-phosphate/5'-hydroxy nucleic acid ligase)